jgi:hypothetical protein
MNHSCDPNVTCSFKVDSNEIIIKSAKNIKSDDSEVYVWNCNGPHYLKMCFAERRQVLNEHYHFNCDCKYCLVENESFELTESNIYSYGFKCLSCETVLGDVVGKKCSFKLCLNDYKIK